MVVYYALGPVLSAWLQATLTGTDFASAFADHRRLAIPMLMAGVALALAWRTPSLEPAALKVADGALVTVAGIFAGFPPRRPREPRLRAGAPIPVRPAGGRGRRAVAQRSSPRSPLSWLLPLGLAIVAGIWAVWRRHLPGRLRRAGRLLQRDRPRRQWRPDAG